MKALNKAAKSCFINENLAAKMIIAEHEIKKLLPKSKLVEVSVDFEPTALRQIKLISKKLKISADAVITGFLEAFLEEKRNENAKTVRSKTLRRKR